MRWFYVVLLMCAITPHTSRAAVLINEIAWMGDEDSANNEWIELYNNGEEAVSLVGWTLTDSMKLDIDLSGSIGPGVYVVLERTDNNSAPGAAFLVYTGALTNSGATLTLKRADGSIDDQVAGGDGWSNIGGDNTTKETAQYTTGGWITAAATPGATNSTVDSTPVTETNTDTTIETSNTDTNSGQNNSRDSIIAGPLDDDFRLDIRAPAIVYVDQTFSLDATPDNVADRYLKRINYSWSFGDGTAGYKQYMKHMYHYPGTYAIALTAKYRRSEQVARHTITVLPVNFSITRSPAGDIQINNDAKYEINLTGYTIRGTEAMTLPENTILLPGSTITIPQEKLGVTNNTLVRLFDEQEMLVASTFDAVSAPSKAIAVTTDGGPAVATAEQDFQFSEPTQATASPASVTAVVTSTSTSEPVIPKDSLPYLGMVGLLAIGTFGVLLRG